jgi:GR25 family glycosyltransferase involved in LPS biosynthesis
MSNKLLDIYCLSFDNQKRKTEMLSKFKNFNNFIHFNKGVGFEDKRMIIKDTSLSCMLGHFDMIKDFYNNSTNDYAIFCEDDIIIHKDLNDIVGKILINNDIQDFDIVLLGYLLHYELSPDDSKTYIDGNFKLHQYNDELWGAQMYLISRSYAKYIIDTFDFSYFIKSKVYHESLTPYSTDWIITKKTKKRYLVYPPLCLENGDLEKYDHVGQYNFHKKCYELHINSDFI